MREYVTRLIAFAEELRLESASPRTRRGYRTNLHPIEIGHLIRPDLICNIYSLLDFRLRTLCEHHEKKSPSTMKFEGFKKKDKNRSSDLDRYRRYFQTVVGIDLKPAQAIFNKLDLLRRIRNSYIHSGGHPDDDTAKLLAVIPGVTMNATLLVVTDAYIFESLENANQYLHAIAQA